MLLTYRNVPYEVPTKQTDTKQTEMTGSNTFARYRGVLYHLSRPKIAEEPQPSVQLKYRGIVYDAHTLQFDTGAQISAEF